MRRIVLALLVSVVSVGAQAPAGHVLVHRLDDGAWIAPHFHNLDKRLVVIRGELPMGRGDTIVALIASGPFSTMMLK